MANIIETIINIIEDAAKSGEKRAAIEYSLHKYNDELQNLSPADICNLLHLSPSYKSVVSQKRALVRYLKNHNLAL